MTAADLRALGLFLLVWSAAVTMLPNPAPALVAAGALGATAVFALSIVVAVRTPKE